MKVAVDLGFHSIKVGIVGPPRHGRPLIHDYAIEEWPTASTEQRFASLLNATRRALAQLNIKKGKALLGLSGPSVLVRPFNVEPNSKTTRQSIAQEHGELFPLPLTQLAWDYVLQQGGESWLVASEQQRVEEAHAVLAHCGLSVERVQITPLCLLNLVPQALWQSPQCTMLVELGAASTNCFFISNEQFYCRGIGLGGKSITETVAQTLNLPYDDAETLKRQTPLSSFPTQDLTQEALYQGWNRLSAELVRAISFYRGQNKREPSRILISGGGACGEGVAEFLQQRLSCEVQLFRPLEWLESTLSPEKQQTSPRLCGLAGLMSTQSQHPRINLDLVSPSIQDRRESNRRRPYMLASWLVWLIMLLIPVVTWELQTQKLLSQLRQVQNPQATDSLRKHVQELNAGLDDLTQAQALVTEYNDTRSFWASLDQDLQTARGDKQVWIKNFRAHARRHSKQPAWNIVLECVAHDEESISSFYRALSQKPHLLGVELKRELFPPPDQTLREFSILFHLNLP